MEMQQVRYFLALSRTLNFTRAAEECHVTQPVLTRSIKLLEDELGGALIRRERTHSHLTDLGRRMLPMLQQCYDAAVSAKSLAKSVRDGEIAPLNVVISNCVNIAVVARYFAELVTEYPGIELKVRREPASGVAAALKSGEADVAIAGSIEEWDRLDGWPLFREPIELAVNSQHRLGRQNEFSRCAQRACGRGLPSPDRVPNQQRPATTFGENRCGPAWGTRGRERQRPAGAARRQHRRGVCFGDGAAVLHHAQAAPAGHRVVSNGRRLFRGRSHALGGGGDATQSVESCGLVPARGQ